MPKATPFVRRPQAFNPLRRPVKSAVGTSKEKATEGVDAKQYVQDLEGVQRAEIGLKEKGERADLAVKRQQSLESALEKAEEDHKRAVTKLNDAIPKLGKGVKASDIVNITNLQDRARETQSEFLSIQKIIQAKKEVEAGLVNPKTTEKDGNESGVELRSLVKTQAEALEIAGQAARAEELAKIEGRIADASAQLSDAQESMQKFTKGVKEIRTTLTGTEDDGKKIKMLQATGAVKLEIADKMTERTLSTVKEAMPEEVEKFKEAIKRIEVAKETFEAKAKEAIDAQEKLKEAKKELVGRSITNDEIKTLAGAEVAVTSSIEALRDAERGVNDSVREVAKVVPRRVADNVQKEYEIEGLTGDIKDKINDPKNDLITKSFAIAKERVAERVSKSVSQEVQLGVAPAGLARSVDTLEMTGPVTEKDLSTAREKLRGLETEVRHTEGRVSKLISDAGLLVQDAKEMAAAGQVLKAHSAKTSENKSVVVRANEIKRSQSNSTRTL